MLRALIVIAGLLLFLSAEAQETKRTRLGFVLSPQLSWMISDAGEVSSNGSLFGYNFGLLLDRFFDDNYAFSTGLTINTSGGKLSYEPEGEDPINSTFRLKYLEVPLTLKLLTNEFHRTKYYGQFGMFSQFNIKASDAEGNGRSSDVKVFDLGYQLGGGLEYSVGGDTYLTVGLHYASSFMDATSYLVSDKATLKRFVFQFGVIF